MFWKIYEVVLKIFRHNQGMRGTFFYSAEHAAHYGKCNYLGGFGKVKKNRCKLDNGKEVIYTEMSGKFNDKASADKFDDYVLLGRGKWMKCEGNW